MPAGPPLLRGSLLLLLFLLLLHFLGAPARGAVYTNHFLVELYDGGQAEAERVAAEHGFGGVRKLPFLESGYFFYHNGLAKARRRRSLQHKLRLEKDSRLKVKLLIGTVDCRKINSDIVAAARNSHR